MNIHFTDKNLLHQLLTSSIITIEIGSKMYGLEHKCVVVKSVGIPVLDLKEGDKFERLKPSKKRLSDTVKMIAYRAETAMANIAREQLAHRDDARSIIRDLCCSEADILPNIEEGTLTIQLHYMANPRSNRAIEHLLQDLNDAELNFPGTNLQLVYRMASTFSRPPQEQKKGPLYLPRGQEV